MCSVCSRWKWTQTGLKEVGWIRKISLGQEAPGWHRTACIFCHGRSVWVSSRQLHAAVLDHPESPYLTLISLRMLEFVAFCIRPSSPHEQKEGDWVMCSLVVVIPYRTGSTFHLRLKSGGDSDLLPTQPHISVMPMVPRSQKRGGVLHDARNHVHTEVIWYWCKYLGFGEWSGFAYLCTWFFPTLSLYLNTTLLIRASIHLFNFSF